MKDIKKMIEFEIASENQWIIIWIKTIFYSIFLQNDRWTYI